jgi:hypothetical protein
MNLEPAALAAGFIFNNTSPSGCLPHKKKQESTGFGARLLFLKTTDLLDQEMRIHVTIKTIGHFLMHYR